MSSIVFDFYRIEVPGSRSGVIQESPRAADKADGPPILEDIPG
jgi:hypothetical protein